MEWHYIAMAILLASGVLGWGLWLRERKESEKWWDRRVEEKNDSQSRIASLQTENGKLRTYESFYSQWQHAPAMQESIDSLRAEISDLRRTNSRLEKALTSILNVDSSQLPIEIENMGLDESGEIVTPTVFSWPWQLADIDKNRLNRAVKISPDNVTTSPELAAEYISSTTGEVYHTTVASCSCVDFSKYLHKKKPCKHILSLALCMNVIDESGSPLYASEAANAPREDAPFTGKKFAFCGRMKTITQSRAAAEVEKRGGAKANANNADVLIVGEHPPTGKVLAAAQAGAKMISEEEFVAML